MIDSLADKSWTIRCSRLLNTRPFDFHFRGKNPPKLDKQPPRICKGIFAQPKPTSLWYDLRYQSNAPTVSGSEASWNMWTKFTSFQKSHIFPNLRLRLSYGPIISRAKLLIRLDLYWTIEVNTNIQNRYYLFGSVYWYNYLLDIFKNSSLRLIL